MICTLLRKPLNGGVINTLPCGGIQIDACRVGTSKAIPGGLSKGKTPGIYQGGYKLDSRDNSGWNPNIGRFPANLMVHVRVVGAFPDVVGATSRTDTVSTGQIVGQPGGQKGTIYQDGTLSASRFFKTLVK
jgi:hypothetical protein